MLLCFLGISGTASHVDVITWAADDAAALRLAEVTTGLPTFLQFLEVAPATKGQLSQLSSLCHTLRWL